MQHVNLSPPSRLSLGDDFSTIASVPPPDNTFSQAAGDTSGLIPYVVIDVGLSEQPHVYAQIMSKHDYERTGDLVQDLKPHWYCCMVLNLCSVMAFACMITRVLESREDSVLHCIVVLGLITAINAAIVTLFYIVIPTWAGWGDAGGTDAVVPTLINNARYRDKHGSVFTQLAVLLPIPAAATRWSLFFVILAAFRWISLSPSACSLNDMNTPTAPGQSTDAWSWSTAAFVIYAGTALFGGLAAAYSFAGAWCESGTLCRLSRPSVDDTRGGEGGIATSVFNISDGRTEAMGEGEAAIEEMGSEEAASGELGEDGGEMLVDDG